MVLLAPNVLHVIVCAPRNCTLLCRAHRNRGGSRVGLEGGKETARQSTRERGILRDKLQSFVLPVLETSLAGRFLYSTAQHRPCSHFSCGIKLNYDGRIVNAEDSQLSDEISFRPHRRPRKNVPRNIVISYLRRSDLTSLTVSATMNGDDGIKPRLVSERYLGHGTNNHGVAEGGIFASR